MKTIKILFLIVIAAVSAKAQLTPLKNMQTPEIANLGLYGTIPVSNFTGIPEISVNLYDINVGDYTLPLSVKYHLASVKPDMQTGSLGLGWSLVAGGYITRSVRCICDEMCGSDNIGHGFYYNATKMKNISDASFNQMTKNNLRGDNFFELAADEFSFSFCGYSGTFYYNENGSWTVISDDDIKVEFNPAVGDGFIDLKTLETRFKTTGWNTKSHFNRFFNKFTLITPDGCRYEFGGIDATEYSAPYYSRGNNGLTATTWRLKKITTVDKHVIEFKYSTSSIMCDIRYVPQYRKLYNTTQIPSDPLAIGRQGFIGFLLFPVNLISITTPNETLTFDYNKEDKYGDRFNQTVYALYWEKRSLTRPSPYSSDIEDPANQFLVFINVGKQESENATRKAIADKLTHLILDRITIKKRYSNTSRYVYFGYSGGDEKERLRLANIAFRADTPELTDNAGGQSNANLTDDMPTYRFGYNKNKEQNGIYVMPYRYSLAYTDSWGYCHGGEVKLSETPSFSKVHPDFQCTQVGTLSEIIYPTGGRTKFEYELHNYSKQINADHCTLTDYNMNFNSGGLRVSSIKSFDENNNITETKKYYYSEKKEPNAISSGISAGEPIFSTSFKTGNVVLELKSQGGYFPAVTNLNTPDVGYSCVIEETLDKNGESLGYVKYRYSNYDMDLFGETHGNEQYTYTTLGNGTSPLSIYTSLSTERGKLLSEEYYDNTNKLIRKTNIKYKRTSETPMKTAYQQEIVFNTGLISQAGWLANTLTCSYLKTFAKDTTYYEQPNIFFNEEAYYTYNTAKLLSQELTYTSKGSCKTIGYKYSSDDKTKYNEFDNMHVLSAIVEKKTEEGNKSETETFDYSYTGSNIPYLSRITTSWNNNTSKRIDYQVNAVNTYGKPTEIVSCGMTSALFWGFKGQRLLAKIDNCTLAEAERHIRNENDFSSCLNSLEIPFEDFGYRYTLKNSLCHLYMYDTNMNLISEILPNGQSVLYKYDGMGRLREKYYYETSNNEPWSLKHVLNRYDYYYK
ncbi:MAG: RHS repeat protein [Prevotella sp.]|nr:RHS repeat protein [Prevotella sp.]